METTRLVTAEEFMAMPEPIDKRIELVRGEVVERQLHTIPQAMVSTHLFVMLDDFVQEQNDDIVFISGLGYLLRRDPDSVRMADLSYVRNGRRMMCEIDGDSFWPTSPDLAIKIVGIYDLAYDVHERVRDFLQAGTRLFWVLHVRTQTIQVYRQDSTSQWLERDDELDGGDVLPGFRVSVAAVFDVEMRMRRAQEA